MSGRQTDTQPSRAATAQGHGQQSGYGRDERAHHRGAGSQSLADRAANFRQGAPFLVERATLYDPEPLDPPPFPPFATGPPTRRLLPAALTLLGVVIVVGLAAGILFVRNADVVRHDEDTSRLQQFSDRALPPEAPPSVGSGPQPNSGTVAYDLTRRPRDVIVGAWRPGAQDDGQSGRSEPPAAVRRRPLPWRMSAAPPEVPPEPVTRPVAPSPSPSRYDAPEPKRRVSDGDLPPGVPGRAQAEQDAKRADAPMATGSTPSSSPAAVPSGDAVSSAPSVVARVGRAMEPSEPVAGALGPAIEIPLADLALPKRRPQLPEREEGQSHRSESPEARRARLLRVQRKLRRQQRIARKREYEDRLWIPEALYGNRFRGVERLLP